MAKWEGSKADMFADKKGAKKAGVSLKTWENSAADKKLDKASMKKKKKKAKK